MKKQTQAHKHTMRQQEGMEMKNLLPGTMSREEMLAIARASLAASDAGDEEAAMSILMKIPLVPRVANVAKSAFGLEGMKEMGYDLSWAVEEFGDDWLNG